MSSQNIGPLIATVLLLLPSYKYVYIRKRATM